MRGRRNEQGEKRRSGPIILHYSLTHRTRKCSGDRKKNYMRPTPLADGWCGDSVEFREGVVMDSVMEGWKVLVILEGSECLFGLFWERKANWVELCTVSLSGLGLRQLIRVR